MISSPAQYDIRDPRFAALIIPTACLDELYSGGRWLEGPVWFADHDLLIFSDIPNNRQLRYIPDHGVSEYRKPAQFANGGTRDLQGRMLTCEHGSRSLIRTEGDGSRTVLADRYQGKLLNSPNDVVVHPDGSIWFTDPSYGILSDYEGYRATPEQSHRRLYRLDPESGRLDAMAEDFNQPNGLAFSPDGCRLYVADSGASHDPDLPRHLRRFTLAADGSLTGGEVFCTIDCGIPDGLRIDVAGNIWCSAADGVHCFDDTGLLLGKILVPQIVANLTFGGPRLNRLYITATRSLYGIYVNTTGLGYFAAPDPAQLKGNAKNSLPQTGLA